MNKIGLLAALAAIVFVGCFRHETSERQLSDAAYLRFPKLESPILVEVQGERQRSFTATPDPSTKYEIPAGTWRITATRDGNTVMDRQIFISAGETREFDLK